ncbi:signal transduction histidine kinase [Pullulanibacillus pueri]|uniref:histidine kinase n=1 Tax=Pullulanibacillus pueri TaxID=1437324 RepID=A0A8J2ZX11_9BACL|nr:histidine kinase N-terminal 7TM domain-containing protein [Pullulanibacillus pueri]MBM7682634.1 signal transduction histidine kinase [Pullulanibacillus pueri]GGH82593.1 two-component sensor histidine kinase [Pullulanibacillus pueri]
MAYNQYLSLLLLAITCCLLFIAYLAWRRKEFSAATSLCIGMCAGAFYSFGYAFEIISSDLDQIRFWLKIEYIGIPFGPILWFYMVLQYTDHQAWLRKWVMVLLAVVPSLTLISQYTNPWHHLFYTKIGVDDSQGFPLASTHVGPFYLIHVFYSYTIVVIGLVMLIKMYRTSSNHLKKQVVFIIIGSCGPYVITLIHLSNILKTPIDISPFGFLLSGIFFIWGIYKYNMMKLVPLAFKKVFDAMKDAVIVLDLDNSITNFNQSSTLVFSELKDQKVIGQSAERFFSPYPELIEIIKLGVATRRKIKIETQSQLTYYQVVLSEVCDKKQHLVGRTLLLSDITEVVLTEERLRSNSKQLSELNTFKDKMFTVVAHDIRDPLSILVSLMEILKDELHQLDESHDEITHEMDQQIQNTFTIVESLLDWFRSQKGGMMFNPVAWNLSKAAKRTIDLLRIKSDRKRIQMVSRIPDDTLVYADKEMLDLIIRNLLTNAIKFTHYDGRIEVDAKPLEDKVIVSIKDTGKGIEPGQARRLLQQQDDYLMSSTGTAGERGIGIGLSLCREFVHIHGGEMWFESVPNQGSRFYFSMPMPTAAKR